VDHRHLERGFGECSHERVDADRPVVDEEGENEDVDPDVQFHEEAAPRSHGSEAQMREDPPRGDRPAAPTSEFASECDDERDQEAGLSDDEDQHERLVCHVGSADRREDDEHEDSAGSDERRMEPEPADRGERGEEDLVQREQENSEGDPRQRIRELGTSEERCE
jgi:hypothetical protein